MSADLDKMVDQAAVDRWAELSGDFNALHVDPVAAARSRYGGTILHGHLSLAWLMERAMAELGPEWVRRGELSGLRFRRPLRPDVRYRVVARPVDGALALEVLLPDGEPGVRAVARLR
ncbi:MAG: 3-hydroxybutyryl-CoA dehydratase [Actinomycetota bacterium]|nr:3-hydroxybutyryl-CoA dehydratase [Actinomycetota bacterium]